METDNDPQKRFLLHRRDRRRLDDSRRLGRALYRRLDPGFRAVTDADYILRRERILIQVVARWTVVDFNDDKVVNAMALDAADATYHPKINDLDWEAATLRRLGYEGTTLWG